VQEIQFVFIFAPQIVTPAILFNQCSNSGKSVGVFKLNTMKTAIQELIEVFNSKNDVFKLLKWIENNKDRLVEKEKEQMIEMYYEGHTSPYFSQYGNDVVKQAEEYYNETYNQNKKQHIIDIMKEDENDGLYNQNK